MCEFFACYAIRKTKEILFCETNDHGNISYRAGLEEMTIDDVVKIECVPTVDGEWNYQIDEATRPEWVERWTGLRRKVISLAKKVDVYHAKYKADRASLNAKYEACRVFLYAKYRDDLAPLDAEYIANISIIPGYVGKKMNRRNRE